MTPAPDPAPVYGLLGYGVAGNPTGAMVEAAWAAAGVTARYVSFDVAPEALAAAVAGLRALGFAGAHVTKPHKVNVVALLDGVTEAAAAIGAVNCVKRQGASLAGDNTDGKGFLASLRPVIDPRGRHAVVLGAGGAARAVAVELALAGAAAITIVNRSPEPAQHLVESLRRLAPVACRREPLGDGYRLPPDAAIVVNATSVGMDDAEATPPVLWGTATPGTVAADIVIAHDTRFLRDARQVGCTTLDGLGMLMEQAVAGLAWWQGIEASRSAMRAAVERALAGR